MAFRAFRLEARPRGTLGVWSSGPGARDSARLAASCHLLAAVVAGTHARQASRGQRDVCRRTPGLAGRGRQRGCHL